MLLPLQEVVQSVPQPKQGGAFLSTTIATSKTGAMAGSQGRLSWVQNSYRHKISQVPKLRPKENAEVLLGGGTLLASEHLIPCFN